LSGAATAEDALLIPRRLAETGLHMRLEVYESLRTAMEEQQPRQGK